VLRGVEQSSLRSVHRECAGCVLSPETLMMAGADAVLIAEGDLLMPTLAGTEDPVGVGDQGTRTLGPLGNMGGPVFCATRRNGEPRETGGAFGKAGSRSPPYYRRAGGTCPRDPGEGREDRVSRNCWRDRCRRFKAPQASQRNNDR